ncbi:MAG: RNA polymerase sigma factor SigC [Microcystis sp. M114S2]|jgi:RNA polymerase nonessential primary-like sigma factor|uniref:RNA polymerase sigma factor SigC n=1 Tax=unclassified Microcystis TaxID=2643300 RepID=UPI00258FEA28|nr:MULTISPECIES: RNA polymerase sigma factor SigC [unclassified Microcystis]MCA2668784.1 RNA polymerase sigma factor SigC [Microcystis sp. M045S2]MCA2715856.1 RNA polymerase sigma factor SigC [Microcystis sp. M172S2]MCA2804737.1 RNA polymerase sigma factor SigC [Microcystis sp. M114S2]MCA2835073.1 RNA polymerase sigma factor SigC [Microcystis sp. M007S1]MCA2838031.1 RNA polymerase sigma factor SigC [Microcystis sp. M078S1]
MSAINPSTLETEFISPSFSVLKLKENSIDLDEDFLGRDLEDDLVSSPQKSYSNRTTTDLVQLYLQDIGRVPLLKREEEVEQAQQVQRHLSLLKLRATAVKQGDAQVQKFVKLIEIRDRLTAQLAHRPSLERWAKTAQITVYELKNALKAGKQRWAHLAGLEVGKLEEIITLGTRAKEQMIKANLRLVVSVAKKYQNRGLELLDLIQEGTLGLERAVKKFDPTKGYRFSTYAYWWIRQGMTRAIATQSRIIRLPVHITEKLNKIKKAQRKISQMRGRTATVEEIAQELALTPEAVRELLMTVPRSVSLEIKVGKEKDTELLDLLETEEVSSENHLVYESLQRDMRELLADLTTREREVIELRYGFLDGKSHSLGDIGRTLELSPERVRQIESKALQKLRQPWRRNQIRDYFEGLS